MPPLDKKGFLGNEIENYIVSIRESHLPFFALADELNEYCQEAKYKFEVHIDKIQEVGLCGGCRSDH